RCVRPRATAARTTAFGAARLSKLAFVWQWRSTKLRIGTLPVAMVLAHRGTRRSSATPSARGFRGFSDGLDEALPEEVEVLQGEAGSERNAVEGVLGDMAGDAGDLRQELVDVPQESPAAGHDHALVDDVRGQLGRRLLEHAPHGGDELLKRRLDRLHDLRARDRDRPRQAGDEVAATHLHLELALERERRADLDLHVLGGPVADHEVVLLADVRRDRLVELVAADAQRRRDDDAPEGDDRDLARPAADVDDHVAGGPADGDVRADRCRERLLDEERL